MDYGFCEDYSMDYDCYQVVSNILKHIGYKEIGNYLFNNKGDEKFFNSCLQIILKKTPSEKMEYVENALYVSGLMDIIEKNIFKTKGI